MKKDDFDKKLNEDDRRRVSPNDVYNLMMKDRPMSFKPGGPMDIPNAPLVNYAIAYKLAQELNKDRPDLRGSDSIDIDTVTQDDIKQMMAKFAQERGADRDQEKFADIAQASRTRAFNKDQANRAQDKFASNAKQMRRSDINKRIKQGIKDPDYSEFAKDLEGLKGSINTIADLRGTMDNGIGSEFALRKAVASQGKPSEPQADGEWRGYDANKMDIERFGLDRSVLPAWKRLSPEEQQERMDASTAWRKALRANRDEITRMLNFDQRMTDEKFWNVLRRIDTDYEMPSVGEYEREQVVNAIKNTVSAVSDVIGPEAVVGYANNIVDITDAATEASAKFLDNAVKPAWQTFKKQAPEVAKDIVDAAKENDVPLVDLFTNFMDRVSRTTINLTNPLKPEMNVRQEDTNNNNKTLHERAELMESSLIWKIYKAAREFAKNRQAAAAKNTPSNMAARSARDANKNPNVDRWLGGRKRINAPATRGQDPATLSMKDQGKNLDANIKRLANDEPTVSATSLEPTPRVSLELPARYRTDTPKPRSGFVSPEEQAEIVAALRQSNPMTGVRYQDEFAATLPDQELRDIMRNLDTEQGKQELADKMLQFRQQARDLGIGESQVDEIAAGGVASVAQPMGKKRKKTNEVAGPDKCWPGYAPGAKTGVKTKAGTGKNKGKRVNNCEKK